MTPHSSDDDDRTYRPREEVEALKANDPLKRFQDLLMDQAILTDEIEAKLQARVKDEVEDAVRFAEEAPYPDEGDADHPVYAEDIEDIKEALQHG